ncbi:DNA repair protein RecO [Amylibacter sp.]|nr:DNA repair protein RecO [Amylibacter sp.]MDA7758705.1 DNA repair protein RecO [Amylibacter sp.]MDA8894460.1 DNA repair protein RecO [Amylibacter sp.]MDA9031893.1 DNA repair protein RecO [Amylibacter sp.]MDA9248487.1 DNA repair protein RecO [Amylibacter sp.]
MMEWTSEGVIVSVRKYGENSVIIDTLTPTHGRHLGVVRGGASRKMAATLQPGSQVKLEWRARLEEHLGNFRVEQLESRSDMFDDRLRLAALSSICSIVTFSFPERMPVAELYNSTLNLMDTLNTGGDWKPLYALWELQVLEEMGFGLDLTSCAVTNVTQDLIYVSPKSGRAVSRKAAGEWMERLLPLPSFLRNKFETANNEDILNSLKTTGHFLSSWLATSLGERKLPEARNRLISRLENKKNY